MNSKIYWQIFLQYRYKTNDPLDPKFHTETHAKNHRSNLHSSLITLRYIYKHLFWDLFSEIMILFWLFISCQIHWNQFMGLRSIFLKVPNDWFIRRLFVCQKAELLKFFTGHKALKLFSILFSFDWQGSPSLVDFSIFHFMIADNWTC